MVYAFAEGTFSSWAVIFLRDPKGLPGMTPSYALSAFWGALVVGRLLVPVLILRVPARLVWIALPAVLMIAAFRGSANFGQIGHTSGNHRKMTPHKRCTVERLRD